MSPLKIKEFKKLFETEKTNLLKKIDENKNTLAMSQDEMKDDLDITSSLLEATMRTRLKNREILYLKKIESALVRIHTGKFGVCDSCEETIEPKRLEARPSATLCISCKEEQEQRENTFADGRSHKSLGNHKVSLLFAG